MSARIWLLFAVTEALLCLTPGPAVLFVISHGLTRGGAASLWANVGILSGNTFYFLLSALGLGAMLLASHDFFSVIRYAGAVYLTVLGIQTMRGDGLAVDRTDATERARSGWRTWARGFALQVANPKALVFFVALLPQFIDTARPVAPQVAILAATSVLIEFVVLAGYGYLAARASALAHRPRFVKRTNLASGIMLIVAGAGVAAAGLSSSSSR
jgi:threonine/homoserine/homoserine lactone efflux protein